MIINNYCICRKNIKFSKLNLKAKGRLDLKIYNFNDEYYSLEISFFLTVTFANVISFVHLYVREFQEELPSALYRRQHRLDQELASFL